MKINKIKIIENPVKDFQLSEDSMEALLGGDTCGVRTSNHCDYYSSGLSCALLGTKCDHFSW